MAEQATADRQVAGSIPAGSSPFATHAHRQVANFAFLGEILNAVLFLDRSVCSDVTATRCSIGQYGFRSSAH